MATIDRCFYCAYTDEAGANVVATYCAHHVANPDPEIEDPKPEVIEGAPSTVPPPRRPYEAPTVTDSELLEVDGNASVAATPDE